MNDLTPSQYAVIERDGPIEYSEIEALDLPMSRSKVLSVSEPVHGRSWEIVERSVGCRLAGSCATWRDHTDYLARSVGSDGGRAFRTKSEAADMIQVWISAREAEYAAPCFLCKHPMSEHVRYECPTPTASERIRAAREEANA